MRKATKRSIIFLLVLISAIPVGNIIGYSLETANINLYQKVSGKSSQEVLHDSSGIPFVKYEGSLGAQYNIVTIAEYAIDLAENDDSTSQKYFYKCLNYLNSSKSILNDSSDIYYIKYDWPGYKMVAPWRSAMNQSRIMQVFIRAFEKTGDAAYLISAKRAMNTLFTQVSAGGVTYVDSSGYWYEEYADDDAPQPRVLNGMIVVLQALSEYHNHTKDIDARFLFDKGVMAVKNTLYLYDNKGHSYYDRMKKPANSWYHNFHVQLLSFLYDATGDQTFKVYRDSWDKNRNPSFFKTTICKPTRIKVFTFSIIFLLDYILIWGIWYMVEIFHSSKK